MAFIEDTVITVKAAANKVCKETEKAVDISRLKLSAAEIGKEISKRYEALGKMIYDSRKLGTDVDGLLSECVKSIDALYARYDDINGRIASLMNKRHCTICGAVVDRGALYCSRCGSRLEQNAEKTKSADAAEPVCEDTPKADEAEQSGI